MGSKKVEKSLFDNLKAEDKDFFITSLEKKVRSLNKKLKEIKTLEIEQKEGKELKDTQLSKISFKAEYKNKIKEFEGIATLYLEAKSEDAQEKKNAEATKVTVETTSTGVADSVSRSELLLQVSALYYAAQYAHQTNTYPVLANVYNQVFHDNSANRVNFAAGVINAHLEEQKPLVNEIIIQQAFFEHQTVTVAEVIAEPNEVVEVVFDEEPAKTIVIEGSTHVAEVQETPAVETVPEAQPEQAAAVAETVQEEKTEQQTQEVPETTETKEVTEKTNGNGEKKTYQKRNNHENKPFREPREPREPRAEGEQGQFQQKKRAPRKNNTNNNENTAPANDGWNVVKKGPTHHHEGGQQYRPKTFNNQKDGGNRVPREGGNTNNNNNNRKPYNKDRPATGDLQYVRKTQAVTEPKTVEAQAVVQN